MNRRAAIVGGLVSTIALSIPAAQAIAAVEDEAARIDRLTQELSEALGRYCGGQFRAVVSSTDVWLENRHRALERQPAAPIDRFHHHFAGLVAAMDEITGEADGWGLQCGRTSQDKRVWHNQQRRTLKAAHTLEDGQIIYLPVQTELVIGQVTRE